jgi:hypothetical protein
MSIKVAWESGDQPLVQFNFDGKWNFLDFDYAVSEAITLMNRVEHHVNWLLNLEASGPLAAGAVLEARELREPLPANFGWVGLVGEETFAQGVASILSRVYPVLGDEFLFAHDVEQAHITLAKAPARQLIA